MFVYFLPEKSFKVWKIDYLFTLRFNVYIVYSHIYIVLLEM